LLRRPQPRAAHLAHGALFLAAWRVRLPEALQPDPGLASRRAAARPAGRHAGTRRRAARACRQRRIPAGRSMTGAPRPRGAQQDAAADVVARTVRADVRAVGAYHVADAAGCIKLDAMESPYGLPPALREAIARAVGGTALNRYPDADPGALKDQVRDAF